MGETVFFEIMFPVAAHYTLDDRHEIEDRLDKALQHARLREVTGGGTGLGSANIDVEVTNPQRGPGRFFGALLWFPAPLSGSLVHLPSTIPSMNETPNVPHETKVKLTAAALLAKSLFNASLDAAR